MKHVLFLLMIAALPTAAQAICGGAGTEITGTVRAFQGQHPDGTLVDVLQIEVAEPIEVAGILSDGCVSATTIQVVPIDQDMAEILHEQVGQEVTVLSDEVFEAHTAWHFGDAVAMDAAFPIGPIGE
jgi:nicotinamidase-related amidase